MLTDVIKDKKMYILSLTETWHDEGSIAFFQLRWQGFTVVDRQCPRVGSAQSSGLHSNHGGLAVISTSSIQLRLLNIDFISTTFEYLATQVYLRAKCINIFTVLVLYENSSSPSYLSS